MYTLYRDVALHALTRISIFYKSTVVHYSFKRLSLARLTYYKEIFFLAFAGQSVDKSVMRSFDI
jgi:hypothetical protein